MNRYGIILKFGNFISKVARIPSKCYDLSRERLSVEKTLFESSLKQGGSMSWMLGQHLRSRGGQGEFAPFDFASPLFFLRFAPFLEFLG